jgi:hypothetical protein
MVPSLLEATLADDVEAVRVLLAVEGVDVNEVSAATTPPHRGEGLSPLFCAAAQRRYTILQLLLECARIDVNKGRADNGTTPLCAAAHNGDLRVVEMLLVSIVFSNPTIHSTSTSTSLPPPLYLHLHFPISLHLACKRQRRHSPARPLC